MTKLNFEQHIAKVKEAKSFSNMFAILIEIENKRYSIENYSYELWEEIKKDAIGLFNNEFELFFDTDLNKKSDLINFFYLSLKLEPNKIKS
jgi:hypothetical protein